MGFVQNPITIASVRLRALCREEVDLEPAKPALLVERTLTRGENGPGWLVGASTKSGKDRRVRLTRPAVTALKDHRKRQLEERMRLSGSGRIRISPFPTKSATPSTPPTCVTAPSSASWRASVREDLRFHDLRHMCATLLLSEGVNAKVVCEMLGHAFITIPLNAYSHFLPDMQDSAADAMEAALGATS